MTSVAVLELQGVGVRFGGIVALDDVSLTLNEAEMWGLIGANGAGKTTLFDVISGIRRPNAGSVQLRGEDATGWSVHRRARAGLRRTFQRPQVFGWLTVEANLKVATDWHRGDHDGAIETMLERCGLVEHRSTMASELPMGLIRMVELARALVDRPAVLLLDEPTSGLDMVEARRLAEAVHAARADLGCAVLLIEHDVDFVMENCGRVVVLDLGRVVVVGDPETVRHDPAVRTAYLGMAHQG